MSRYHRGEARVVWAEDEVEFVLGNADHMSDTELAAALRRICDRRVTSIAVKELREMELGIRKNTAGKHVGTPFHRRISY